MTSIPDAAGFSSSGHDTHDMSFTIGRDLHAFGVGFVPEEWNREFDPVHQGAGIRPWNARMGVVGSDP